jgi:hypothetical protein
MSPPVDIIDIITNISQNTGDLSIMIGAYPTSFVASVERPVILSDGDLSINAPINPMIPKIAPKTTKVC